MASSLKASFLPNPPLEILQKSIHYDLKNQLFASKEIEINKGKNIIEKMKNMSICFSKKSKLQFFLLLPYQLKRKIFINHKNLRHQISIQSRKNSISSINFSNLLSEIREFKH